MTAPDRAAALRDLQKLVKKLRANPSIPVPRVGSEFCPLAIYAPEGAGREGLEAWASSLDLEDQRCENRAEENGWPYLELTGRLGTLYVRIAAGDGPLVITPLHPDASAISRTYPHGTYPLVVAS